MKSYVIWRREINYLDVSSLFKQHFDAGLHPHLLFSFCSLKDYFWQSKIGIFNFDDISPNDNREIKIHRK